jgi:TRAP-type C4-dicarboxylate transport system permease small subunit
MQQLAEALAGAAVLAERVIRHAMAGIVLALVLVNVAGAVGRYGRWYTWPWADEALLFGMVWGIALGLYAVTLRGGHLAMDLVVRPLPRRLQRGVQGVVAAASFALLAYVVVQSLAFVQTVAAVDMRSMAARIPMAIPHAGVLTGLLLVMLALFIRAVLAASGVQLPPERRQQPAVAKD